MASAGELRQVDPADLAAPLRTISHGFFVATFIGVYFGGPVVGGVLLAIGVLRLATVTAEPSWRRRCELMLGITVVGTAAALVFGVLGIATGPEVPWTWLGLYVVCWLIGLRLYLTHMRRLLDTLERAKLAARWQRAERRYFTCLLPAAGLALVGLSFGMIMFAAATALYFRFVIAICGAQGWTRAAAEYELQHRRDPVAH